MSAISTSSSRCRARESTLGDIDPATFVSHKRQPVHQETALAVELSPSTGSDFLNRMQLARVEILRQSNVGMIGVFLLERQIPYI